MRHTAGRQSYIGVVYGCSNNDGPIRKLFLRFFQQLNSIHWKIQQIVEHEIKPFT
jgi:hypothetical protein